MVENLSIVPVRIICSPGNGSLEQTYCSMRRILVRCRHHCRGYVRCQGIPESSSGRAPEVKSLRVGFRVLGCLSPRVRIWRSVSPCSNIFGLRFINNDDRLNSERLIMVSYAVCNHGVISAAKARRPEGVGDNEWNGTK